MLRLLSHLGQMLVESSKDVVRKGQDPAPGLDGIGGNKDGALGWTIPTNIVVQEIILFSSVSDPDPLHLARSGSGSTSIPAPDPDPDPLRFLFPDPDQDPVKKALIRVAPKQTKTM